VRPGGAETVLIGNPRKGHTLAFGRNPVNGSLVGVATVGVVVTVSIAGSIAGEVLLGVRLPASGTIGSLVAIKVDKND